jgi:DNA repair protein RadD
MLTPRYYQKAATEALWEWLPNNDGHPLICHATGTGKSLLVGEIPRQAAEFDPNVRVLIVAHRKELIQQNYEKVIRQAPHLDSGVYSASAKRKDLGRKILVSQIQSVHDKANVIGYRDLVIVDEAHLLDQKQSKTFANLITHLQKFNPKVRVIGLTATPWRMKGGSLIEGEHALFTDIIHEYTISDGVRDGYLAPLISKASLVQVNKEGVRTVAGDYNQKEMAERFGDDALMQGVYTEIRRWANDRKAFIVFCTGVQHAERVAEQLGGECITQNTKASEREDIIERFRNGQIRFLTNCDTLTTGFDAPNVDCIIMLRSTKSSGLYVQMLGRGTRLHESKENCLVLDFAGNVENFGPIEHIKAPKAKKQKDGEKLPPIKICPECREPAFAFSKVCQGCGYRWPDNEVKHDTEASDAAVMQSEEEKGFWLDVDVVRYKKDFSKKNGAPMMVVSYDCGMLTRRSYWLPEHEGYARTKTAGLWKKHIKVWATRQELPSTVDEAVKYAQLGELKEPSRIFVKKDGKYWRIEDYDLTPNIPRDSGNDAMLREIEESFNETGAF